MAEALHEKSMGADSLRLALGLMEQALHFLDEGRAPADIGAHLDLAIVRLRQHLSARRNNLRST